MRQQPTSTIASRRILRNLGFLSPNGLENASTTFRHPVSALTVSSCGSKHDHLLRAKAALPSSSAEVPPFFGFSDEQINKNLSSQTRALWQTICDKRDFGRLEELQKSVEKDILTAPIPFSASQRAALRSFTGKILIVRSSSDEDTMDGINAGGNESVAGVKPTEEGLQKALAKVVASYFSAKSLRNRSAFTDPFAKMPSCSALVMVQIEDSPDATRPIVSGVMMTHKTAWFRDSEERIPHITASFGFGGGIVSGKTPSDEFILPKGTSYSSVRSKHHRTGSLPSGKTQEVVNHPSLRDVPCLTEKQLRQLQDVGVCLEKQFHQPLDVEFVIRQDKIYVVQVRAIQAPEIQNPTFIDLTSIPITATRVQGVTLIPGMSQVLSLTPYDVLYAKDLDEANRDFVSGYHKAVLIYQAPASSNTHEEVNFSSQRPPVPCFVLPQDAWQTSNQGPGRWERIYLCPQRGIVVLTDGDLAIKKGLIQHPARPLVTVDETASSIQSAACNPEWTRKIRASLGVIQEQSLSVWNAATEQTISDSLQTIEKELTQWFVDISKRSATQTAKLQQVTKKIHALSMNVFQAMQKAAEHKHPTLLSFHAGILQQLLEQTGRQVVGAHSLVGLEETTVLPPCIEFFLKTHEKAPILCELALLSKKAWGESFQQKWLTFLQSNQIEMSSQKGGALLEHLKEFDQLGMLSLWFAAHFSGENRDIRLRPQEKEFMSICLDLTKNLNHLAERVQTLHTEAQLIETWQALQVQTESFLQFCSFFPNRNLMQDLQLSRIAYDLIQSWDAQIKVVRTSKIYPEKETANLYQERILQFAAFGLQAIKQGAIAKNMLPEHQRELHSLLTRLPKYNASQRALERPFSVQHWMVPLHPAASGIPDIEAKFTIIHQNLLRAAAPPFTPAFLQLLPPSLARAVQTFQTHQKCGIKRFEEGSAAFLSLQQESASVTFNIPLNFHSFVLTVQENKGDDSVRFHAHWKGSDNNQGAHLEFLQLFCARAYPLFINKIHMQQVVVSNTVKFPNLKIPPNTSSAFPNESQSFCISSVTKKSLVPLSIDTSLEP